MRNGWDMSKIFKGHCFAHISVISHLFGVFLVLFWRVSPLGCGYGCARVRVRVSRELPMGYPHYALKSSEPLQAWFTLSLTKFKQASASAQANEEAGALHTTEHEDTAAAAQKQVEILLQQLWEGQHPQDDGTETVSDQFLNGLCYKEFPALCHAWAKLSIKAKDKKLDVLFWGHITAMVTTLNFYLDPELSYSWQESLVLAEKALGHGVMHAQNLWKWINNYLQSEKLPLHCYRTYHSSILEDEDFKRNMQLHLMEIAKKGYIHAQDIVDYVGTPEVQ